MSKITWDNLGERFFETGVDRGVLYPMSNLGAYEAGVAWNGLTGVTESPSGADLTDFWADNIKYASIRAAEEFGATIEAYTYPDEFAECDGSAELSAGVYIGQQTRKHFGFSFRTSVNNDQGLDREVAYKLHLIYNASASPSEKAFATINDSPEAITFSWELETTGVAVTGYKPTSTIVIDATKADPAKLAALEKILYGDTAVAPRLPLPDEVAALLAGTPVVPAAPTFVAATGIATIVATPNVVYKRDGEVLTTGAQPAAPGGTLVTITAHPAPGYYIASGVAKSWSFVSTKP